jgi:hypothetical protein
MQLADDGNSADGECGRLRGKTGRARRPLDHTRLTPADPDQTGRTGALSRSTTVPLPNRERALASQSARALSLVSFEELMFLLQNSVDVLAPLSSALSELIFQAAARPRLLINLARPPSSSLIHHTSSTPHQHHHQPHTQLPWPAPSRPPVSASPTIIIIFIIVATVLALPASPCSALVLLSQFNCRHLRAARVACLCRLPHHTSLPFISLTLICR